MSDDPNAAGVAGSEQETIAGAQGAADSAGDQEQGGARGGLATLADDGGETASPADWPADWRERLAGSDETALRNLKRFGSVDGLWKKIVNQDKLLSDRAQQRGTPALPEDATEEQVAEYRKALGVPEAPDGYGVALAPELQADDHLKAQLDSYLAFAHERNLPPGAVKAAVEWQQAEILRQREEQSAAAARERARVTQALRKEYGAEYKRNLALADEFLSGRPGLAKLVSADNPDLELVRDIIALARDTADGDALYSGDGESGGKSLDEQIDELSTKAVVGKLTPAEDKRYMDALATRERRRERQQRNRAA
jgi:hypothetical protein